MSSRSHLLVLLVLACLQVFTEAQNSNQPATCCIKFTKYPIPLAAIEKYQETRPDCSNPGVVFTLKNGRRVCADPRVEWVQRNMRRLDQRLFDNLSRTQPSA